MILINRIYKEELNCKKTRLCAEICNSGEQKIWIELDNKFKEYLCDDISDGFVVGLLLKAMETNQDIVSNIPISEQLLFYLKKYLIPFLCKLDNGYRPIKIVADIDTKNRVKGNHVGTGISCGVDSLSTVLYHYELEDYSYFKIDTLLLANTGYYGYEKISHKRFQKYWQQSKEFAESKHLPLIIVDSNISEFAVCPFLKTHTYLTCAIVLMMQNYFRLYYYASGYPVTKFKASSKDSAYYDVFLLNCISTNRLQFVSSCSSFTRNEKTSFILDYRDYSKYLYVCKDEYGEMNCGRCPKCVRTLLDADSVGKIDSLSTRFDITYFKRNRIYYLAYAIRRKNDLYFKNTLNIYRKDRRIPFVSYLLAVVPNHFDKMYYTRLVYHFLRGIIKK